MEELKVICAVHLLGPGWSRPGGHLRQPLAAEHQQRTGGGVVPSEYHSEVEFPSNGKDAT